MNQTLTVQQRAVVSAPGSRRAAAAARQAETLRKRSLLFVHLALVTCLILQRFGLSLGGSMLFLSLPAYGALVVWMVARGQAAINRKLFVLYSLTVCSLLVSTVVSIAAPDRRVENSMGSLGAILVTYSLLTVKPNERFDTSRTLDIFLAYVRVLSVLGIVQYAIQYVGISIFSFSDTLPWLKPILVEHQFAFRPVIAYGSAFMRSNGFFLLEPSTFSQVLVFAIAVEFFVARGYRYLPLYGVAYLVTHSGTGLLSLLVALAIYGLSSPKGMVRTLAFALAGAALAVAAAVVAPSIAETFMRRANELDSSGSSGYARYVAQFDSIAVFIKEARCLIGYGPGATERSIYWVKGSGNPALKLFIDYGIIGLITFSTFLVATLSRTRHVIMPILSLVMYQLGGGHLLFTPFIVMVAVVCIWSRPLDAPSKPRVSITSARPRALSGELSVRRRMSQREV